MADNPHARQCWDGGALHDITPGYFYFHADHLHQWTIRTWITGIVFLGGPKDSLNGLIPVLLASFYTSEFILSV